jgi:hypothetical protein
MACYPALRSQAKPQRYRSVDTHHRGVIQTTDCFPDLVAPDGSQLVNQDL